MSQARRTLTHLSSLESESIHIIREVAAEMSRPCVLFSGGKDSAVLLFLASQAFAPAKMPFPVMHVDTGLNFAEVIDFRDNWATDLGVELVVASVQEAIDAGLVQEEPNGSRNRIQTPVLLEAAEKHGFNALFGGARRDEEKARAKERIFSFRDSFGQWDPKNQRPELWSLYNGRVFSGESMRVFPLSNWTEIDIWRYIEWRSIELPSRYFASERQVVDRGGLLFEVNEFTPLRDGEQPVTMMARYRTIGDGNLTACVESMATTLAEIIEEIETTRFTERGATRGDDRVSESSMEDRKREGYF